MMSAGWYLAKSKFERMSKIFSFKFSLKAANLAFLLMLSSFFTRLEASSSRFSSSKLCRQMP